MAEESRGIDCVTFSRGYELCIMGHRRDLSARLTVQCDLHNDAI